MVRPAAATRIAFLVVLRADDAGWEPQEETAIGEVVAVHESVHGLERQVQVGAGAGAAAAALAALVCGAGALNRSVGRLRGPDMPWLVGRGGHSARDVTLPERGSVRAFVF
jgi:hypothetical protein